MVILQVDLIGTFLLQSRDNATYECLAENGVGEPVRATAVLKVFLGKHVFLSFTRTYRILLTFS